MSLTFTFQNTKIEVQWPSIPAWTLDEYALHWQFWKRERQLGDAEVARLT